MGRGTQSLARLTQMSLGRPKSPTSTPNPTPSSKSGTRRRVSPLPSSGPPPGPNPHEEVTKVRCPVCSGSGYDPNCVELAPRTWGARPCAFCDGEGLVTAERREYHRRLCEVLR